MLGLVKYTAEALKQVGVPVDGTVAAGVMLPVVLLLVWYGIRRIHRSIDQHERHGDDTSTTDQPSSAERTTSIARTASVSPSTDAAGSHVTPR